MFFLVTFEVEKPTVNGITLDGYDDNDVDDNQQGGNEDDAEAKEDEDELGGEGGTEGASGMDTEIVTPKPRNGTNGNAKKICYGNR
jgi:hypothetical protein